MERACGVSTSGDCRAFLFGLIAHARAERWTRQAIELVDRSRELITELEAENERLAALAAEGPSGNAVRGAVTREQYVEALQDLAGFADPDERDPAYAVSAYVRALENENERLTAELAELRGAR